MCIYVSRKQQIADEIVRILNLEHKNKEIKKKLEKLYEEYEDECIAEDVQNAKSSIW